ncbi:GNAT family N-acetyltransferase [Paenibacillus oenotherae]|uniref:GNAT family N-acetyltransferase n=1 Tax=Paenibacillus oenotherae TaxID=1435645 RepID=A0ABS7D6Q4_9BACL|nr:GNAT family N-acetyltransferase [Paenibacillus oenotherae]MBW7475560.1 GNAT family N-acetyltransferase [Paenibacillus oenotherae]
MNKPQVAESLRECRNRRWKWLIEGKCGKFPALWQAFGSSVGQQSKIPALWQAFGLREKTVELCSRFNILPRKGSDFLMIIHSVDFKNRDEYRASFNRLAALVFGIEFEEWYQKGAWDDRYICHSIISDGRIIANASVSKLDLLINGERKRAIQIGTVMTHPEHRGKGLSKQLMEYILDNYEDACDLFFLFANSTALDFYPKFGFVSLPEHQFHLEVSIQHKDEVFSLDKLDVSSEEHWNFMKQMLRVRRPISQQFGITNNEGLFQFYALHVFPECLYYSRADDAIIVFEHDGELMHLYDIVSDKPVDMEALILRAARQQTRKIRFHFTPDQLIGQVAVEPFGKDEDVLFVKSLCKLGELPTFCVPKLAHA